MRQYLYLLAVCLFATVIGPGTLHAVSAPLAPVATGTQMDASATALTSAAGPSAATSTRKATRAERKGLRKQIRQAIRDAAPDTNTLLLIILAIFIPPLAMFLYEGGLTTRFWISLLLTLLFFLPGIIYTIYIIGTGK